MIRICIHPKHFRKDIDLIFSKKGFKINWFIGTHSFEVTSRKQDKIIDILVSNKIDHCVLGHGDFSFFKKVDN